MLTRAIRSQISIRQLRFASQMTGNVSQFDIRISFAYSEILIGTNLEVQQKTCYSFTQQF